jgi:hypothetical protein
MSARRAIAGVAAFASLLASLIACSRERWPGPKAEGSTSSPLRPMPAAPEEPLAPLGPGGHPRILLTPERVAKLEALAHTQHPSWAAVQKNCGETVSGELESGYEGEDWANAALDLALCARFAKGADYGAAATKYLLALIDDKEKVGDKHGGLPAVEANDGYSIRNRGFLAAIAFDWLFDTLPPEVRKHAADRFDAFCTWYAKDGYKHDDPIANHYMSYFGACAMGGVALEGEDPRGSAMRKRARAMWSGEIVPAYKRLGGGDFPEGWQYARIPGSAIAFYVEAEGRASKRGEERKTVLDLPWLRESIAFQAHALEPDGRHCWDNADWSKKPATPFPQQLYAAALALPKGDLAEEQALFLARAAVRPEEPNWNWLQAIADDPGDKGEDPRKGATSYLARGTGTVLARTDWGAGAVWIGMNASPAFGDHQHLDQGHFEVVRGADALIIDPGDYDSYATITHNSILVDDAHENLRWTPNQGIWGKDVSIARFEDSGRAVYAEATFGAAYNPDGYPEEHRQRSVTRAERELVLSRAPIKGASGVSARLVIYDRVTVTKPTYGVTWAAHASVTPQSQANVTRISLGESSAIVSTLIPASATAKLLKEPTLKTDEMFMKNDPAEGIHSTRIEIASPKGHTERRFLHVIAIGGSGDRLPAAELIAGEGAEGASLDGEAYVFVASGPQILPAAFTYTAPMAATRHIITGLMPAARYGFATLASAGACRVSVLPGGSIAASQAGTIAINMPGCALAH